MKLDQIQTQVGTPFVNSPQLSIAERVQKFLDQSKAEDIFSINLEGKSLIADHMVIASGNSGRFLKALAEKLKAFLHQEGIKTVRIEGTQTCDWVLVDGGDIVIHLFRPEVREEYNLEGMWGRRFEDQETLVS